jgi:predicted kinase
MNILMMLRGLPASGKSTYAKATVLDSNWKRVNKDDLRAMIDNGQWSKSNEKKILEARDLLIELYINSGYNVIVDDTNLHPKHEVELKNLANKLNATFSVRDFPIDVEEAIKRDLARPVSVGEKVIRGMYNQFLAPKPEVYNPDSSLPKATIVDIDGTLAINNSGRSPFHWNRVNEDDVNEPVADYVRHRIKNSNVLIVSGRDSVCRDLTIKWLYENNIPFNALFMRQQGDNRKDSIIKKEIFDNFIKDKYNIELVLDDRNQVVEMWRSLGLTVWQVNEGDF